jgi:hypothetical protein
MSNDKSIVLEYIENTRHSFFVPTVSKAGVDYDDILASLVPSSPDERLPTVVHVSTLEKMSEVVDFGAEPILVLDHYLGATLSELFHLCEEPSKWRARALANRILAEYYLTADKPFHAALFAVTYSMYANKRSVWPGGAVRKPKPSALEVVQEAFYVAHEFGHVIWHKQSPAERPVATIQHWILSLTMELVESVARDEAAGKRLPVRPSLREQVGQARVMQDWSSARVVRWMKSRSGWIEIDKEISDAEGKVKDLAFIEEVWADYYAWLACVRMFAGSFPSTLLLRAIFLARNNMSTMLFLKQVEDSRGDSNQIFHGQMNHSVIAMYGINQFLKENGHIGGVTGLEILNFGPLLKRASDEHRRAVLDPMLMESIESTRTVDQWPESLKQTMYQRLEREFGPDPVLTILRDKPIDGASGRRLAWGVIKGRG